MDELDKWEFGSRAWCEFASRLGVQLIKSAELDLNRYGWGFSEEYLSIPARLLDGRNKAGYHLMVSDGVVSGGPTIPEECLELPGFHVAVEWAPIAHSSYLPFNSIGNQERGEAHIRLCRELKSVGIGDGKWVLEDQFQIKGDPDKVCRACGSTQHLRPDCPMWPPGIGEALGSNPDMTACKWRLKRSPELEGFPESDWGVPLFHEMDDKQKQRFTSLLGH